MTVSQSGVRAFNKQHMSAKNLVRYLNPKFISQGMDKSVCLFTPGIAPPPLLPTIMWFRDYSSRYADTNLKYTAAKLHLH